MKTISIGLACNLGSSTSILVNKMKSIVAKSEKLSVYDVTIESFPASNISNSVSDYDVILLAPQIAHREEEMKEFLKDTDIPVKVIDSAAFGMMDGASILKEALYLVLNK